MRLRAWLCSAVVLPVGLTWVSLWFPAPATAKVFYYAITIEGELLKYDPDADRVVQLTPGIGQGYIHRRNVDESYGLAPDRVLDISRRRIVTQMSEVQGVVLLDMAAVTATKLALSPAGGVAQILQIVYPRKGSRFHVQWLRQPGQENVLTSVDLTGRVVGTVSSMIADFRGGSLLYPDGRSFYVLNEPNTLLLVDGETLAVRETYDMSPFYRLGATGHGIADVRDGRVLLSEGAGTRNDLLDPRTVFTVDLSTRVAFPRIDTGLGASTVRLMPGGRTILLQEAQSPSEVAGAGRLHFYDVTSGNKLGTVTFSADRGAILLGIHPDGRRLFFQARVRDVSTGSLQTRLVIVDWETRTVLRDRPFLETGFAVDFVDEP